MKEPKRGEKHHFGGKTSIPIIREIGTTLPTSTMGHGSPNFSMYKTTSNIVRTQVAKLDKELNMVTIDGKKSPSIGIVENAGLKILDIKVPINIHIVDST